MLCMPQFMLSNFYPHGILTTVTKNFHLSPCIYIRGSSIPQHRNNDPSRVCFVHSTLVAPEREEEHVEKEKSIIKWHDVGPDVTEVQKQAISELPPKMTNRCKALMKRIICFSPEDEKLSLLLAAWITVMKPRRADWLAVLKEMKRSDNPLLLEVMELALLEDSFEANARDYTKLIDRYAKNHCIESAETAFQAMRSRVFPCDQVTLTVLVNVYSKAGQLNRAKEVFQEIQVLGLPLDKRAYGSMVMAYVRAGMLDLAESLMKEMEAKEICAGREVYKALLRAHSTVGDADGLRECLTPFSLRGLFPTASSVLFL